MSLIHEALQKAESERRAGELPSLLSATRVQPKRNRTLAMPLLLFAGVLIVAAAAYNNRSLIENSLLVKRTPTADAIAPATGQMAPQTVAVKPDTVRTEPATTVTDLPPPLVTAKKPAVLDVQPVASQPPVVSPPTPESEPVAAVAAAADPMSAPAAIEPITEVAIPERRPEPVPEPQVEAPAPTATASTEQSSAEAIPYIFELPLETRQALPNLKVTMHVYNVDPGKRFAIIDGKRVNEGGVVGNELDMVEIQRDALLMKFRNERFLMPRLGR